MKALILTAGNGTRIRAISHCRSKCMLPVQGRPLLAWHLDHCVDSGQVDAIHIVVHPQETQIQSYFGASYRGVPLSYHVQSDLRTGLVGAIFSVDCPQVTDEPTLLLLGDEYLPQLDLASLLETAQRRPQALLAVVVSTEQPEKIRQNYTVALDKDDRITQAIEKPQTPLTPYIGTGWCISHVDCYPPSPSAVPPSQTPSWWISSCTPTRRMPIQSSPPIGT